MNKHKTKIIETEKINEEQNKIFNLGFAKFLNYSIMLTVSI